MISKPEYIASKLTKLINDVGPLWEGSRLSGYDTKGPYHCGNCKYLKAGNLCTHELVILDMQLNNRVGTFPLVDPVKGCCEFVDPK